MQVDDPAALRAATRLRTRIALYAAAATVLFVIERQIPNPVPWVRLGLANAVTLVALVEHGFAAAGAVVALRVVLGGFFAGALFGPQFVLSVSGAVASWLAMGAAARLGSRLLSPLGLSLVGAAAHAFGQLAAADRVLGGGAALWSLVPLFVALSIVTGVVTGLAADAFVRRLGVAERPAGP